jgi:phosphatidylglycerol:prolipoprotein diacylglycerol transferase
MLPNLIDLPFLKIPTFGIFLVLAFFWGTFILWRNIKLTSHKEDEIFDGLFFSVLGALFVSRLFYVILHFKNFGFNPLKFILINGYPGLTIYGALIGGFLAMSLYLSYKKIPFLTIVDYFISPLFLALAIGKAGAFISGTEPGSQTHFILAIKYSGLNGLRHIVGLYEALLFALFAYITYKILFAIRRATLPKGFAFYFFCFMFSAVYLLLDKFKQNHLYFSGINFNFFVSLVFVFVFGVYLIYFFRREIVSKTDSLKISFISYGKKFIKSKNRSVPTNNDGGGEKPEVQN